MKRRSNVGITCTFLSRLLRTALPMCCAEILSVESGGGPEDGLKGIPSRQNILLGTDLDCKEVKISY